MDLYQPVSSEDGLRRQPNLYLGGYVDGDSYAALLAAGWDVYETLRDNDAYHALRAVDGLLMTGPTGTNVNDVGVALAKG